MKISQASSSGQKVHTPVVEEVGELTDEELLKLREEMHQPKKESGRFNKGVLWKIEKDKELIGYLFGTIHMNDKRVNEIRKNIVGIFDENELVLPWNLSLVITIGIPIMVVK